MSIKYLRNTDDATIVCRIPSDKNKSFVFRAKKVDKRNNIVISNGYSEISEEDLELLRKESSTFQYYEAAGKLSLVDSLPQEAMSVEQLVMTLKSENELLKQQIAEGSVVTPEEVKELQEKLKAAEEKIEEQAKTIDALDTHLAEMADELNAATAAKPETVQE